ncbi:MAG: hypothetical protein P0119_12510 [Nitrospira sp.]|nr:hypothetical protein [Nitrospira sp.]
MAIDTLKQEILQVVEGFPNTVTFKDAIERLCFLAKVEAGIRQSDSGETIAHVDAVRQLLK